MPRPKGRTKRRKDPKRRPLDAVAPWAQLEGKEPGRHYVWVNTGDQQALATYSTMGYKTETWQFDDGEKPKGVRPGGGRTQNRKAGQEITMMDCVLMSIDGAAHQDIVQYGPFGDTGLEDADRIEEQIVEKRGMDPLRGLRGYRPGYHMSLEADSISNHEHGSLEEEIQ